MAGSNYEVNIKLNLKSVNKQLNNLEKRISRINKLAQGGRASRTVNKNEQEKLKSATKRFQIETRTTREQKKQTLEKRKQFKIDQDNLKLINQKSTGGGRSTGGGVVGGGNKGKGGGVLSGALISGAFPLLFGQGLVGGAVGFAGGAIGGKIGGQMGGFAGGLIATAGLTLLTNFRDGINDLGKALDPTNINIEQSIEKLKIINRARAAEIKLIEQFQGSQAALAEITKDTAKVIGNDGVRALREFADTMKLIGGGFSAALLKIQAFGAEIFNRTFTFTGGDLTKAKENLGADNQLVKDLGKTNQALLNLQNTPGMTSAPDRKSIFRSFTDFSGTGTSLPLSEEGEREKIRLQNLKKEQEFTIKLTAAQESGSRFQKEIGVEHKNLLDTMHNELAVQNRVLELRKSGLNPSLAKQVFLIEKSAANVQLGFENEIKGLDELIQIEMNRKEINNEKLQLLQADKKSLEDQLKLNADNLELEKNRVVTANRLARAAQATQDSFDSLRQTISTDLADGIQGLIRGTTTLNQVMNNVLNKMIDAAFNMAFFGNAGGSLIPGSGLFGNIFKAEGGPVKGGRSFIVGEKGPEVFTPGVSGMITPNHALGGSTNVVVNVDASGSSVEGDEQGGRELGRVISAAVQSELIQQKRPGGLLA